MLTKTLVVGVGSRVCAIPLAHVIETMRPLPIESIAGMPAFVSGVSIVRGVPTPVVDLWRILGAPDGTDSRFVTVHVEHRQVALAVSAVLGVRDIDRATLNNLPPLLQGASTNVIETISALDSQILVVLRSGWKLPDEVWRAIAERGTPA